MRVFHSDCYPLDLPPDHRFPISKYGMLRQELISRNIIHRDDFVETPLATKEQLLRVHTQTYVNAFMTGDLDPSAQRRIGLPWSEQLVNRCLASVGATVAAARTAMKMGVSGALSGGTHHSFEDRGEGFCVFNDIAVAIRELQYTGQVKRVLIVDLDVHQGNGNAKIFQNDPSVFTFSMHGAKNFPFRKEVSDLDVPLHDGIGDDEYLDALCSVWPDVLHNFDCDLVFYQAGVDVLNKDAFGRLKLSHEGIKERDRLVLEAVHKQRLPIVLTLGGGYAKPIQSSVTAYAGTYEVATQVYGDSW
ncbi:MAG: histone deacetylase [Myxococcota bacterium]|nr:histone deacetylase [Myxococcota bacterium]